MAQALRRISFQAGLQAAATAAAEANRAASTFIQ